AIRLASSRTIHESRDVTNACYHAAGATAIFTGNPFERRLRDMSAIAQQLQGRRAHYETVGKFLLGLDTDAAFFSTGSVIARRRRPPRQSPSGTGAMPEGDCFVALPRSSQ